MLHSRRTFMCGAAAATAAPSLVWAQGPAWPSRPIRIIIPTAAGGSPDLVARQIGARLTERLGQPVVVESVTQGIGLVANQMVSKAAPDGYTFSMLTGGFTTQAAVMKATLPYDPINGFSFVTTTVAYPMFLLVAPNSPIASFQDLVDRARREPGKINLAILGSGSVYHLLAKWIQNRADIAMGEIPYRGTVAAFTDLIGGRTDAMLDTATSAITRVKNGQLRALAVSSPERYPLMPDVPTMDATVPGIKLMSWLGLAAPPKTPRPIVDQLNAEVRHILALPDIKQWLDETGVLAAPSTPEEFQRRVASEIEFYGKLAEANGIKAE